LERVWKNLRIVSLCTVLSRVLGLVRDAAMAATFGNGPVLDAFSLAFRIPNLGRALLGEGAIATAFLPALVAEVERDGTAGASRFVSALLVTLTALLCALVGIAELALWGLGGVIPLSAEAVLLRDLTALLMPYVIFICLAAQVATVLHASGRFLWPALIPVVLNLVWLAGLWGIVPLWSEPGAKVRVMSACLVIGGAAQLLFPLPALWSLGYRPVADWRRALPEVRAIFGQAAPVLIGLSITQVNVFFDSAVAWTLARPEAGPDAIAWLGGAPYPLTSGTASALYFGQRLYQFPLGVFGVALGTVLYPLFAAHAQRGDWTQLRADFSLGVRLVVAIGLPASAGLVLLAEPLAAGCFEYGRFDAADTRQTAQMIAAYGLGVWAYCGLLIVNRAFYALGDRRTPLNVGFAAVGLNVALSLMLIWPFAGVGLAIATSLVAMTQCLASGWLLTRRLGGIDRREVSVVVGKAVLATLCMGLAGYGVLAALQAAPGLGGRALRILVPLVVSLATYFAAAALLKFREPWDLVRTSKRAGTAPTLEQLD
jgi:putative peptidoglycan lipid II flippase